MSGLALGGGGRHSCVALRRKRRAGWDGWFQTLLPYSGRRLARPTNVVVAQSRMSSPGSQSGTVQLLHLHLHL